MANTLKSKKEPKVSVDALNPDKTSDVSVTEVVKDERTSKIMGPLVYSLLYFYLLLLLPTYLLGRKIRTWCNFGERTFLP